MILSNGLFRAIGFKETPMAKWNGTLKQSFLGMVVYLEGGKWLFWSLTVNKDPGTFHQR